MHIVKIVLSTFHTKFLLTRANWRKILMTKTIPCDLCYTKLPLAPTFVYCSCVFCSSISASYYDLLTFVFCLLVIIPIAFFVLLACRI